MQRILRSAFGIAFTATIALQGAAGYFLNARKELVPATMPLSQLPATLGNWTLVQEYPMDPEVQAVLRADDTVSRLYGNVSSGSASSLFIAFFKSQRSGVAPHSPKNCLPGNGWVPERNEIIHIDIPGRSEPIEANYYVVQHGDRKNITIYWYQSHSRTVASEYKAKAYVVADAIRLNRTDTALVRIMHPVGPEGLEKATEQALAFTRAAYGPVAAILPR
jgi:EpsI family protein